MKAWIAVPLLALLATPALADKDEADIVALINKGDAAAVKARSRLPLSISGVWFPDAKCAELSGKSMEVDAAKLPLLVECMAGLGMRYDGTIAAYEPGVPVKIGVDKGGKLVGFASLIPWDKKTPTVLPTLFRAQLAGGKGDIAPEAATKSALAKAPSDVAWVHFVVCVDATGAVDELQVMAQSDDYADYATTVEKAARMWKTTPFRRGGKAMRVCTIQEHSYPPGKRPPLDLAFKASAAPPPPPPPPPPLPPPPPTGTAPAGAQVVPPTLLEGYRIAGDKLITPDEDTKKDIQRSGKDKLVGSFKLCVSDAGAVASVTMLKSTGFAAYDNAILTAMKLWKYRPYEIDGKPVPVCTAVTFIYTQK